jgi:hypothetical protein
MTGGVRNSDMYAGFAQQNSGRSQTPMPIQQKQPSRWNRTKKFFGGLKQKFSNKMSGVAKFMSENPDGNVKGQANLHYFVLDENKTLYSKIQELHNKDNISSVELSDVNNQLYNKLKTKGLLAQIVKNEGKYKFDNTVINQNTKPGKVRIFTYKIEEPVYMTIQNVQAGGQNIFTGASEYQEPQKNSNGGYMSVAAKQSTPNKQEQKNTTYLQVFPSTTSISKQPGKNQVNNAPAVKGAPPPRQAGQARLAAAKAAKPRHSQLPPANNSGLPFVSNSFTPVRGVKANTNGLE